MRSRRQTSRRLALLIAGCAVIALGLVSGCSPPVATAPAPPAQPVNTQVQTQDPSPNLDPCAMRLHDLAGMLLLHFATHQQLPATLDEMDSLPGLGGVQADRCPIHAMAYIYQPAGILLPERGERIIVFDAKPHAHRRWAIRIQEPRAGHPLIAHVVSLPESFFAFQPR